MDKGPSKALIRSTSVQLVLLLKSVSSGDASVPTQAQSVLP